MRCHHALHLLLLGLRDVCQLLAHPLVHVQILGDAAIEAHRLTLGELRVAVLGRHTLLVADGRHAVEQVGHHLHLQVLHQLHLALVHLTWHPRSRHPESVYCDVWLVTPNVRRVTLCGKAEASDPSFRPCYVCLTMIPAVGGGCSRSAGKLPLALVLGVVGSQHPLARAHQLVALLDDAVLGPGEAHQPADNDDAPATEGVGHQHRDMG